MIDRMVKDIPGSEKSVRLIFRSKPFFRGRQISIGPRALRPGRGELVYTSAGVLLSDGGVAVPRRCSSFFARAPPQHLYVKAEGV